MIATLMRGALYPRPGWYRSVRLYFYGEGLIKGAPFTTSLPRSEGILPSLRGTPSIPNTAGTAENVRKVGVAYKALSVGATLTTVNRLAPLAHNSFIHGGG